MKIDLYQGDCLDVMATLEENSVDTIILDPPAGIFFMGKKWDSNKGGSEQWIAWLSVRLKECLRVAKPGAMMLCWSIPRTSHWTGTAIEQAGWEVRDVITHIFGSGFPKSANISKNIDKAAGAEREVVGPNRYAGRRTESSGPDNGDACYGQYGIPGDATAPATPLARQWDGWGTALKPACEFWWLAMAPRDGTFAHNAEVHGVAGLNIDGSRVPTNGDRPLREVHPLRNDVEYHPSSLEGRVDGSLASSKAIGTTTKGRWPANLILDGEAGALLDAQSGITSTTGKRSSGSKCRDVEGTNWYVTNHQSTEYPGDTGGASRFFYCAKASRAERNAGLEGMEEKPVHRYGAGIGRDDTPTSDPNRPAIDRNIHPCVKPLALMRYLVRLTRTPTGGVVLDPFMGSGTTGIASVHEGRDFIGIELDAAYLEIARKRIEHAQNEVRQLSFTGAL